MATPGIGKLEPRHRFILNHHASVRECPRCHQALTSEKFALFIHVEGWRQLCQGKTCSYCGGCDLIVAQKDELDAQVKHAMQKAGQDATNVDYVVVGTLDQDAWQKGMQGGQQGVHAMLDHVADFKEVLTLQVT